MVKPPKAWSWSYSKLKNFETCPRRHYEIDLQKNYTDTSEALTWGNDLHAAMAKACTGAAPLPPEMSEYQYWVDRVKAGPGTLYVEQKYAITKGFTKTSWFGSDAWFRGIGDVVRVDGPVALGLDWKTGKVLEDSVQLALLAQCIFSHFPDVKKVRTEFIWLKEGDCTTPEIFDRADMSALWGGLLPRVSAMQQAHDLQHYPPLPGKLCARWCPVQSCPHHGKGPRR